MNNLDLWNKVNKPPPSALKTIQAGRLKGMTDINPQWRIQVMTEQFGQIGIGWYYEIIKMWTEQGSAGELMAFVHIHLFTWRSDGQGWSSPIAGVGGSALVAKESAGLRANDEAYKMALTDALSVAMKQLGVASAIYEGRWDGSKYKDEPIARLPALTEAEAEREYTKWQQVKTLLVDDEGDPDNDKIANEWGKLQSNVRTAIKKHGEKVALTQEIDANAKEHIKSI
jgi:hypothetical protein